VALVILVAICIGTIGLIVTFGNYYVLLIKKQGSVGGFLGGTLLSIALWIAYEASGHQFHWAVTLLPFVIDPGSGPLMFAAIKYHWKRWRSRKSF